MKKRVLAMILALSLAVSLLPTTVLSANATNSSNYTLTYDEDTKTVTISGVGTLVDGWLNASLNIGRSDIEHIVVENGITEIGKSALANFSQLRTVQLPEHVSKIDEWAFTGLQLDSINLPGELEFIGRGAFEDCIFNCKIILPNKLKTMDYAFYNAQFKNGTIKIPKSVESYNLAFSLSIISHVELENGITNIGAYAFAGSKLSSITIPGTVTTIGEFAFQQCTELTHISLPKGLTSFKNAFWNSCLQSVEFEEGLSFIDENAFKASALVNITIPDSVKEIKEFAFDQCKNLTNVNLPNRSDLILGSASFSETGLRNLVVPDGTIYFDFSPFLLSEQIEYIVFPVSLKKTDFLPYHDAFTDIYYKGTEEQWNESNLGAPLSVTVHYESSGPQNQPILGVKVAYTLQAPDSDNKVPVTITATVKNSSVNSITDLMGTLSFIADTPTLEGPDISGPVSLAPGEQKTFTWNCKVQNPAPGSPAHVLPYKLSVQSAGINYFEEVYNITLRHLYTISFDLNGGSGSIAPQIVQEGNYITRPTDPTWSGYTFNSWYSESKNGVKLVWDDWYESDPVNGNMVDSDLVLHAGWANNKFVYGVDNYNFTNLNNGSEDAGFSNVLYNIRSDYYDIVLAIDGDLTEAQRRSLGMVDNKTGNVDMSVSELRQYSWFGSCFGMSAVLALIKANRLDVRYFQKNANCPYDFDKPLDNATIESLINYYQLMQVTYRTTMKRKQTDPIKDVIPTLNKSNYPVIIGYKIFETDLSSGESKSIGSHAVLGYDYILDANGDYLVSIWDPNTKDKPQSSNKFSILRIKSDNSNHLFENFEYIYDGIQESGTKSWYTELIYAIDLESNDYDYKNLEDALQAKGYVYGYNLAPRALSTKASKIIVPSYAAYASNDLTNNKSTNTYSDAVLYTNYQSFAIKGSDNSEATIVNGKKKSGSLNISDAFVLNDLGTEFYAGFLIPNLENGVSYEITPVETTSVVTGAPLTEYVTTLMCNEADDDGFYSNVNMKGTGTVTFFGTGKTETTCANATEQSIDVVRNDFETPWYSVATTGTTTGMIVDPSSVDTKEVIVSSKDDAQLKITVGNTHNSVDFDGVNVGADGVIVTESTSDKNTAVIIKSGTEQAKQTLGHTVILYTSPETPINIKSNIAHGSTAYKPADPTLEGYVFDGWYDSPDGTTPWNFDTPLTEDLRLFAKWTKKDSSGSNPSDPSNPSNPSGGGYYPSTSYSISVPSVPGGKLSVNPSSASAGKQVTITATPDAGYQLNKLTVSDNKGQEIALTNNGSNQFTFKMPNGKVTIDASFVPIPAWYNPFTDVSEGAWYFDAIKYVNSNGLMNGVGDGRFAPDAGLSRAMLVQILYNKEGRPSVSGYANSFSDVDPNSWYADAVTWAATKQITLGYDDNRFGPNDYISREQLATMLWRYFGTPSSNYTLRFDDAGQVSDYALDALKWAAEKGVINGYQNKLSPQNCATRAEVAQMLKNYAES